MTTKTKELKMTPKQITIDNKTYNLIPAETKSCDLNPVHAGYHPVTGRAIFYADRDLPRPMKYVDAVKYIAENCHGWRLPTVEELWVIYANREHIGNFKTESGSGVNANWYWSCTEPPDDSSKVWSVRFSDGTLHWDYKDYCALSVRPVRLER